MTDNPSAESRARPAEIIFEVTEAVEGGYDARALGYSIYTQGEDWDDLKEMARDAVLCHFDEDGAPRGGPAASRSGGGQHQVTVPRHRDVRIGTLDAIMGLTLGKDYRGSQTTARPYLRVANVQDGRLDLRPLANV